MKNKKLVILIIVSIVLCIMLALIMVFAMNQKSSENDKKTENVTSNINGVKSIDDFENIKEIIEFSDSKYIKEQPSSIKGYDLEVFAEFKYNLYNNNESKEKYFLAIINRISYFLRYDSSYILKDEDKNIEIKVKCDGERIVEILINGEKNYYINHNNKNELKNLEENKITEVMVQAEELKNTINADWKYDESLFGEKESEFNKYILFWNKGIDVRKIQGKVYNIVFNSRYDGRVISGLTVKSDFKKVIEKFGEPSFGNEDLGCIGYKTKDFYIFFSKKYGKEEISVYRNENIDVEEFEKILSKFLENKIDIKKFMNELTDLWPDYESYDYSNNYLRIMYPDKGVKIEYGEETENSIFLYENYNRTSLTDKLLEVGEIQLKLADSLYLECEKNRSNSNYEIVNSANYMNEFSDKEYVVSEKYMYSFNYNSNKDINKIYFISKDEEKYFDKELNEYITSGFMISDDYFIYGREKEGIFLYNIVTNEKQLLISGDNKFKLKEIKGNELYYDDEVVTLEME